MGAVHIEPKMLTAGGGVMVTVHGNRGESFARFRENDTSSQRGSWHKPDARVTGWGSDRKWSDAETSVDYWLDPLLDLWHSAWKLTYSYFRDHPEHFAQRPER